MWYLWRVSGRILWWSKVTNCLKSETTSSSMEEEHQCSRSGEEPQTQELDGEDQQLQHQCQQPGAEEKLVLQFMDSMDNYLSLFDAVSSTLRQVNAKPFWYKKFTFLLYPFLILFFFVHSVVDPLPWQPKTLIRPWYVFLVTIFNLLTGMVWLS